jgi:hypothetical protein
MPYTRPKSRWTLRQIASHRLGSTWKQNYNLAYVSSVPPQWTTKCVLCLHQWFYGFILCDSTVYGSTKMYDTPSIACTLNGLHMSSTQLMRITYGVINMVNVKVTCIVDGIHDKTNIIAAVQWSKIDELQVSNYNPTNDDPRCTSLRNIKRKILNNIQRPTALGIFQNWLSLELVLGTITRMFLSITVWEKTNFDQKTEKQSNSGNTLQSTVNCSVYMCKLKQSEDAKKTQGVLFMEVNMYAK